MADVTTVEEGVVSDVVRLAANKANKEIAEKHGGPSLLSSELGNPVLNAFEENVRLENEARTDHLTGLRNDRVLDEDLRSLQSRYDRSIIGGNGPLVGAILAFDLTGLAKTNNSISHEAGDQYLQRAAETLKEVCRRGGDTPYRNGGQADEFTIVTQSAMTPEGIKTFFNEIDEILSGFQEKDRQKYPGISYSLSKIAAIYGEGRNPVEAFHLAHNSMGELKKEKQKETGQRGLNVGSRIYR